MEEATLRAVAAVEGGEDEAQDAWAAVEEAEAAAEAASMRRANAAEAAAEARSRAVTAAAAVVAAESTVPTKPDIVWPDDPTSSFGSVPDLLRDVSVIEGMDELSARTLEEFIAVSTRKLLVGNVQPHVDWVVREFTQVVGAGNMRPWSEVQKALAGDEVHVEAWKSMTRYSGYQSTDDVVTWWWDWLEERDGPGRRAVFAWATGYAGMPFAGNGVRFEIQRGLSPDHLPSVATCSGVMRLPPYESRELLATKLAYALSERGFHLA